MKYFLLVMWLCLASSCSYPKLEFEKQSGKVNAVKAGKRFCVSLPEDHADQHFWGVNHDYNKKHVSYVNSVFHGKTVEFTFDALKPGTTELFFVKTGYKDTTEMRSFVVKVE